jgi:TRAP-type transport system periplasmic protein
MTTATPTEEAVMTRSARSNARRFRTAAAVLSSVLILAACSSDSSPDPAPAAPAPAAPSAPAAPPVIEGEYTIIFSSIFGPTAGLQTQLDWYMDQVEERTSRRVVFERFYGASLLGAADTLPGIVDGRANAGYMVPAYAPTALPLWNATFVPTENATPEAIARSQAEMAQTNDALRAEFEAAGIKMLVFNMIADLGTVGTTDPITKASDLSGQNIRALGYLAQALQLRGANPVVVEAQETYESIQRGVINGAGGFAIDVFTSQGLQEVAPWMVKMDIGGWVGAGLAMNADFYDALPDEIKAVMDEVAGEFYDQATIILTEKETAACDALLAAGGGVTLLPAAESAAWRADIGDSLWSKWRTDAAAAGAAADAIASVEQDWRALTTRYNTQSKYVSGLDECAKRTTVPN